MRAKHLLERNTSERSLQNLYIRLSKSPSIVLTLRTFKTAQYLFTAARQTTEMCGWAYNHNLPLMEEPKKKNQNERL